MSYAIEIKLMSAGRWQDIERAEGGSYEVFQKHMSEKHPQIIPLGQIFAIERQIIGSVELGKIALKKQSHTEHFITDVPYSDFVDSLCVKIGPKPKRRGGK